MYMDKVTLSDYVRSSTRQFTTVGTKIAVKWSEEEVMDSRWRTGWYIAEILNYKKRKDEITKHYPSEPTVEYKMKVQDRCLLKIPQSQY